MLRRTAFFVTALCSLAFVVRASGETPPPVVADRAIALAAPPASAVPAPAERLDPNVFRCGPIQTKDAAVRERIAALYREEFDLRHSTLARLRDISRRGAGVTDAAQIRALQEEGAALKRTLVRRHMEIGLEIARLNEDAMRAAEFDTALDHVAHPQAWMPIHMPDPELQARRLRELEVTK